MSIKPTHVAKNRKTGEVLHVEYDEKSGEYKESPMVALIEKDWDISITGKTQRNQ